MNEFLNRIENDEIVVYEDDLYSLELLAKSKAFYQALLSQNKAKGKFDDARWLLFTGVEWCGLNFEIDKSRYASHFGQDYHFTIREITDQIKCYIIYNFGNYIYETLASKRVNIITSFVENIGDESFSIKADERVAIEEFLAFIGVPVDKIEATLLSVHVKKTLEKAQRKLKPIINYLLIEHNIKEIYSNNPDPETYIQWFPVFFWVNVTFIIPLRATEMLITPYDCISQENGKYFIHLRRSLKKLNTRNVYYSVDRDYKLYDYQISDNVAKAILHYQFLTQKQHRNYLFMHSDLSLNKWMSLSVFNDLLSQFFVKYIQNNSDYDYIKFAARIDEFECVTAGDSRPIALTNLYYSNIPPETCMEIAGHSRIATTSHYYTNISETIMASSIMKYFRYLDKKNKMGYKHEMVRRQNVVLADKSVCLSKKRLYDPENIDDCVLHAAKEDCMFCPLYICTKKELDNYLSNYKKQADESSAKVIDLLNKAASKDKGRLDALEMLLKVQQNGACYRFGTDKLAEERLIQWEKNKNTQKTSS